jgi:ATP-dependent Zn protease
MAALEQSTRKPLSLWDRAKYLLLLALLWLWLVWAAMADNVILPFQESMRQVTRSSVWIPVLAAVEVLRQLHFFVSEKSERYHRFWTERVFGGVDRMAKRRMSDWTRFRLARAAKLLFWVAVLALVLAKIYHTSPALGLFQLPAAIFKAMPFAFQLAFAAFFMIFQFAAIFWFLSKGGVDTYYPDDVKTRFSDVWGQDHVLERVQENMVFLDDPESIESKGGYVPGGILLWGPPGTGKTLMAEAVAGETGKPYVFVDPGAFQAMFMGVGILKVKSLYRRLRRLAMRYGGVIVFFDEADSLGKRGSTAGQPVGVGAALPAPYESCNGISYLSQDARSLLFSSWVPQAPADVARGRRGFVMGGMGGGGGGMGTLQALLTEMSGLKKPRGFVNRIIRRALGMRPKPPINYRILTIMATNMPNALDDALLRPGRIDRIYHVGYPSKAGRLRTYQGYFDKVDHEITPEQMEHLATITPYATGATIKDLVNESLIVMLRDGREVITWRDVLKAKLLKSVGPAEGVEYIERERHAVAVHEACHAVMSYLAQRGNVIDTATIQKGQGHLGFVQPIPIEERFTSWRSEYDADIMVSVASLVGERLFFGGDNSSGVSGDLQNATTVALAMEGLWGMGQTYRSHAPDAMVQMDGSRSIKYDKTVNERAEEHLAALAEATRELLSKHRDKVLAVAHALETYKTISGDDIVAIIEGGSGPIVDGTPYADMVARAQLETYHQQALAVHEGRDKGMVLPLVGRRIELPEVIDVDAQSAMRPSESPG